MSVPKKPERDFWERTFDEPKAAKWGCLGSLGAIVVAFGLLVSHCSAEQQKADIERQKQEAVQAAEAAKEKAENQRKGFHCLSPIDGSEPDVVEAVKARLRDPDSFQHIETRITPVDVKGVHHLMMRYRSRNGFGGMVEGAAIANIVSDGCGVSMVKLAG